MVTELPVALDGVYIVTVQRDDRPTAESTPSATSLVDALQPVILSGWPTDSRFGRDELYDADGR